MTRKKISWKKIWDDYDIWVCERADEPKCATCGEVKDQFPTWEQQQEKIKELVNAQLVQIKMS